MNRIQSMTHFLRKSVTLLMTLALALPPSLSAMQLQELPAATLRVTLGGKSIEGRFDGTTSGTKTEVRTQPDGSKVVTATDALGNRMDVFMGTDGSLVAIHVDASGKATHFQRDPAGNVVSATLDENGNFSSAAARFSDASVMLEDAEGNIIAQAPQENGGLLQTTLFRNGNVDSVLTDASGEVVARGAALVAAKEPGQEYYERVLKGTDWSRVPNSSKVQYAASERQEREAAQNTERRQAQLEADKKEKERLQKTYADNKAKADAEVAAMQADADAKDAERRAKEASEERQKAIAEAYETAARLRNEHQEAVARGDVNEARRIEREQDKASEASMKLLEFTPEEHAAMDRKQSLRDQIMKDVIAEARAEAVAKADNDTTQSVKEGITSVTKYASMGSAMQQETAASTRLANYQVAFSEAKDRRLRSRLDDPKTSKEEREIIENMLKLSEAQKEGATEQLLSNAMLTTAGYLADGASIAASAGAGALLRWGATSAAAVTRTGVVGNVARSAGKNSTKDLFAKVPIKSELVKSLAANAVVGGTVDAGVQVWRTGTVDPVEMARSAVIGTAVGSAVGKVTSAVAPKVLPKRLIAPEPAPRPASSSSSSNAGSSAAGARGANSSSPASTTEGGLFDRPGFKDVPSKPPAEFPDLGIWKTPQEKAAAANSMTGSLVQNAPPAARARQPIRTGNMWDRPEFKNLPPKPPVEAPSLDAWRTPAERAGKPTSIYDEPTVIHTPEPKPAGGSKVYDQPTVRLTPRESAKVGSAYDEPTVVITPDPPPARSAKPAPVQPGPKIIYPVETTNGPAVPPQPKIIYPVETSPGQPAPKPAPIPPTRPTNPPSNSANRPQAELSPSEARARSRATVPPKFQREFDKTMDIVDRLRQADPRFNDVDYSAVAQNIKLQVESGVRPEELAATALNMQGHKGAQVSAKALSEAANLPHADAESAVRAGWEFLGKPSKDPNSGGLGAPEPAPLRVEEYDLIRDEIPPSPVKRNPNGPKRERIYEKELRMSEAKRKEDIAKGVPIFSVQKLENYRVISDSKGRLIYASSRRPVDLPNPNFPGLYVMDSFGNFYVHPDAPLIRHSSLAAGRNPAAAGMLNVENGVVRMMNENTGHYGQSQPIGNVHVAAGELKGQNVDLSKTIRFEGYHD